MPTTVKECEARLAQIEDEAMSAIGGLMLGIATLDLPHGSAARASDDDLIGAAKQFKLIGDKFQTVASLLLETSELQTKLKELRNAGTQPSED